MINGQGNGQIGQGKGRTACVWVNRLRFGQGFAEHFNAVRRKVTDLYPPRQERRAVPIQNQPLRIKPNAIGIGDREAVNLGLRTKGPFEPVNLHLTACARQVFGQEINDDATVCLDSVLGRYR